MAERCFTDEVKGIWIIPKAVFDEITEQKNEYGVELHEWGKDRVVEVEYIKERLSVYSDRIPQNLNSAKLISR